jgi:hypothetical protein
MVEAAEGASREGSLQIRASKEGFTVEWSGKKVVKGKSFSEEIAKIWGKALASTSGEKKAAHVYRLSRLASSLEQAEASLEGLSEEAKRSLETAKKSTITSALILMRDQNDVIDFTKLNTDIASSSVRAKKMGAKEKCREIQNLMYTASLLQNAFASDVLSTPAEKDGVLMTATAAYVQAQLLMSSLEPGQVPASLRSALFSGMTNFLASLDNASEAEGGTTSIQMAKSALMVSSLQIFTNSRGEIDWQKIEQEINAIDSKMSKTEGQRKIGEVRRLAQLSSLLFDAVHIGSLTGKQAANAIVYAKVALRTAQEAASKSGLVENKDLVRAVVKEKIEETVQRAVLENGTVITPSAFRESLSEEIKKLKSVYPQSQKLIDAIAIHYEVPAMFYDQWRADLQKQVEGLSPQEQLGKIDEVDKDLSSNFPCRVDKEKVIRSFHRAALFAQKVADISTSQQTGAEIPTVLRNIKDAVSAASSSAQGALPQRQMKKLAEQILDTYVRLLAHSVGEDISQDFFEAIRLLKDAPNLKQEVLALLDQRVKETFGDIEQKCATRPPDPAWPQMFVHAQQLCSIVDMLAQERGVLLREKYKPSYQAFSDSLMYGMEFQSRIHRDPDVLEQRVGKISAQNIQAKKLSEALGIPFEEVTKKLTAWAGTPASRPIRQTFGRIGSIVVGGKEIKRPPGLEGHQEATTYFFFGKIVENLKQELHEKGIEKTDEEIEEMVGELMMRCCGDASIGPAIGGITPIAEDYGMATDSYEVGLDSSFFRFSVDDGGSFIAEKGGVMKKKSLMTGDTEYTQITTRITLHPQADLETWIEDSKTEPYGAFLGREVVEEADKTGEPVGTVLARRKETLAKQITSETLRQSVIADMEKYLEKRLLPKTKTG